MTNFRRLTILLFLTAIVSVPIGVQAQKSKLKFAQGYYDAFDFANAMIIYRDILSSPKHAQDSTALRMLADCEVRTNQYSLAEGHLKMLLATPAAKTSDMHKLAEVLKIEGKYEEAIQTYQKILFLSPDDQIASRYAMKPDFAESILRDSIIYKIRASKINSPESDFAPGFFVQGKLIFSSSRGQGIGAKRTYNWNQQPYLNVYISDIKSDSTLDNATVLTNDVNSRYHEGTMTYDPGNNLMYLTRNNFVRGKVKKSKSGRLNLAIYTTQYSNGEWGALTPFPFNNKEYSVGHPSLTPSGKRIYFTSDMPGGYGGTDIYYSERDSGNWSAPKNAGPNINTNGNEVFPFAVGDSTLYFSSNGWLGLGGLDMYYIDLSSDTLANNMGYPANSHFDDFGVVLYPNQDAGYFGSNRPGGLGDDDIYEFILTPPDSVEIAGRVVEVGTLKPLGNARVFVPTDNGTLVETKTNDKGEYTIKAPYSKVIRLNGEKKDYEPGGVDLQTNPRSTQYTAQDIELSKTPMLAKGKVVYDVDGSPAEGALVRLLDMKGIAIDSTLSLADGSYKIPLPEAPQKLTLEVTKQDYVKLTHEIDPKKIANRTYEKDFRLFKLEKGTVVRLDNIYYDYGKADIRPDAALELNKLVLILNDNPTVRIELSSHTDARGGDAYNMTLSDKRAKSAVNYIISQGIDASRLVAKGYGETKLLNRCANDVKCSEEEHQFNRRTEFKILDI